MKRTALTLSLAAVIGATVFAESPAPPKAPEFSPRSKALEIAGAFANDGYKARDGFWSGQLEPGKPVFLEVNLFAGNEYWFCGAAASPGARKLVVSVYGETGKPCDVQIYSDGPAAAAGFEPGASGRYFVKLELAEGDKAEACLLYCYK